MLTRSVLSLGLLFALVIGLKVTRASDAPPAGKKPGRVIIDSSRDGGVWWFPQAKDFTPDQPHQGNHFADLLKQLGYEVTELPREGAALDFSGASIVVRFCFSGEYSDADVAAYRAFVERGGRLILARGFVREERGMQDKVAAAFGFNFSKLIKQGQITKFEPNEITRGIVSLPYNTGSIIDTRPDGGKALASTDDGAVVMAEAAVGKGRVIALSTPFALLQASEAFAKQLLQIGDIELAKREALLPTAAAEEEAETTAKLNAEKAVLTKRLAEINAQLDKIALAKRIAADPTSKPDALAAVLRGHVRNETGEPLAGVRVRVAIPITDMRLFIPGNGRKQFEAITGEDGEYRLEISGITKPSTISMDAMKPGYRRLSGTLMRGGDTPHPEVAPGVVTETNLKLEPALYFKGLVIDENGKPIPSVSISAYAKSERATGGVEITASNQDGEFELFNYPAQPFAFNGISEGLVNFSHPKYVIRRIDDVYSVVENERPGMRIILSTGYKVSGTVRDVASNPLPRVMIKAIRTADSHRKAVMTDANGKFALQGLPEGPTVLSARALDIQQKIQLPIVVHSDTHDLDVRLRAISLPPNLESFTVLGMRLADLTPELKGAYDHSDNGGALILDPGPNSERWMIGKLAQGYNFWMVGNKRIASVREFVEQILSEANAQKSDKYSIRVVYSFSRLDFDGTNTQYLKLTKDDIALLKTVLDQLPAVAK